MYPLILDPPARLEIGCPVNVWGIEEARITEVHPDADPPYWVAEGYVEVYDQNTRKQVIVSASISDTIHVAP